MRTRLTIYIVSLAALLVPSFALAYGEGYYEPYYQGYYQATYSLYDSPYPIVIGRQYDANGTFFQGYMDEVRLSNVARWSGASFTPPSSPYTSDSNTLLLLHMGDDKAQFYDAQSGGYFAYPAPSGYKAVSTANLPAPVTDQPANFFNAITYTGNGSSQTVPTTFAPDLVWIKNRFSTYWNLVSDSARGANSDLFTNSTAAATQNDSNGWLNTFGLGSFSVGGQCVATPPQSDLGGNNYVAWAWKKSTVAGTDVVSYTGDGNSLRTIAHSLGTIPDAILVKGVDQPGDWYLWTSALTTPASYLKLNTRDAETTTNSPFSADLLPQMTGPTTNGVTMSSSNEYSSWPAWKAADNDPATYWESNNVYATPANPQWIKVDLGAGNPQTVGAYSMRSYTNQGYAPVTFTFEGSNDNAAWNILDTREYVPWTYGGADTLTFTIPAANRGSYRYYRINITKSTQYDVLISEMNLWNANSFPDATQFNLNTNALNNVNVAGKQYMAYVFSNREGFQKTGTYIGNASTDGTFVYTGFRPKLVMIKNTSVSDADWIMLDSARSPNNPRDLKLSPDSAAAENDSTATQGANTNQVDFLSNGFKMRSSNYYSNTWSNCQGGAVNISTACYKYAYIAFADAPFKTLNTANGYNINNSMRFNASNNSYLERNFGTPTSALKGTISFWVKRGGNWGSWQWLYGANASNGAIIFDTTDHIRITDTALPADLYTNEVFRDPTAWVHLVFSFDSTAAVGSRIRAWANNVPLTFQSYSEPATPLSFSIFGATLHNLGVYDRSNNYYFDGNIAEFNYIDGLALTPSSFGAYDGSNYWKPKAYTDVYNKNGFYLNFSDRSALGADSSGKNNHWYLQQNNMPTYEQSSDSPTNNFATLNLQVMSSPTYNRATLQAAGSAVNGWSGAAATWKLTSGKWYWENVIGGVNGSYPFVGVWKDPSSGTYWRAYPGHNNDAGFGYSANGYVTQDAFATQSQVSGFLNGDIIGVAYDADTGKVYFSRNGVWQSDNNSINLIPRMTAYSNFGVTMGASRYYTTGYEPWRAGDQDNQSTYWYTYGHVPTSADPDWLRVDLGAGNPKTVSTYSIQNYYGGLGYDPINFTFEGSNDTLLCSDAVAGSGSSGAITSIAQPGAPNTGSGGGAGGYPNNLSGANGANGIVVLKYGSTVVPFTSSGSWTVPGGVTTVDALVVGGGGGGGGYIGGGGGAGGYRYVTGYAVTPGAVISVTVGTGGAGNGSGLAGGNGNDSVFGTITATGGGGGGPSEFTGTGGSGGSGGGSGRKGGGRGGSAGTGNTPATTPSQGSNGGTGSATGGSDNVGSGGGGGGAAAVGGAGSGATGGAGGNGISNSITGTAVVYAAGGGGGAYNGTGGAGGGPAGPAGSWTVLDTESNVLWTSVNQVQYFPVPVGNQASYRCYRVKVTGAGTIAAPTYYLIINQLGLYNTPVVTAPGATGYNGIIQNGTPGITSYYGRSYINFGQGTNPGVTFTDSSGYARPMVEATNGIVTATSTVFKFGAWSMYNDSGLAGGLTTPATPNLNVTGDFTIDLWAYPTRTDTSYGLFSRDSNNGYSPYMIYQSGNTFTYYGSTSGGGWEIAGGNTICTGITVRTWYHIAVVRSGNNYYLYCNGVKTNTITSAGVPQRNAFPLVIGRQYNGGAYFNGYLDEVRFSDTARWTGASFTVPTSEYTSDANTLLLLHMTEDKAGHYYSSAGGYFAEPPPAGYKALNTTNLPAPAAIKPVSYFDAKTYSGNAGAPSYDQANKGSYITLSNNNYDASSVTNCCWANGLVYSSQTFSSGKWYAEFKITGNYPTTVGIGSASKRQTPEATLGYLPTEYSYYPYNGTIGNNNVFTGGYPGLTAGDVIMVAVDMNAGNIWFGKNGTWLGTGNPSAGTNPQYTGITGAKAFAVDALASAGTIQANFGQSGRLGTSYYGAAGGYFTYAPPTGFSALPSTGSQDISLVFKPDLVWIKNRTAAYANVIADAARGAGSNLFTNSTVAQVANDTNGSAISFNSPGFTAGAMCASATGTGNVNAAGANYIAWAWKKSPTAGVDIVTYSGNNALSQLISHSLGTTPDTIIVKRIDSPSDWLYNSQGISPGFFSKLNTTDTGTSYASPFSKDLIPVMNAQTTAGVTMTASVDGPAAWQAGNKNPNDYWGSSPGYPSGPGTPTPQWLRVDFGAGSSNVVAAYTMKAYHSILYQYADQDFTFEGSNDAATCSAGTGVAGSVWTVLDTEVNVAWIIGEVKTFQVPQANQAAYRCYRLRFTRVSRYEAIVNELNLWAAGTVSTPTQFAVSSENGNAALNAVPYGADLLPTKTSNVSNGITMSGSVEYQPAYYASDKNNNSYWSTYSTYPNNRTPVWLRTDFISSAPTLAAYSIRNYVSNNLYDPVDFVLQASNDATTCTAGGSAWTAIDTRTAVAWAVAGELKTFLIPTANQAAYRCYRVYITKTSTVREAIIAELNLYPASAGTSQYVAYLFSNREGFQKSGDYFGNGSGNGPVVYTGFKPRFVMIKDISRGDSNAQWVVVDSARSTTTTTADLKIAANSAVAENDPSTLGGGNYMSGNTFYNGSNVVEFLSNGFKLRSGSCATNCNQERFIYIAFAEIPFKTANTANGTTLMGSVRFDQNLGSYLSRNNTFLGNRQKHTFSAWIKRGSLGSEQAIFTANTGSMNDTDFLEYKFNSNDQIVVTGGSTQYRQTYDTFRDTTKWYHIVIAVDTTLPDDITGAAANKRIRLYVDGREIKTFWCVDHVCQTP